MSTWYMCCICKEKSLCSYSLSLWQNILTYIHFNATLPLYHLWPSPLGFIMFNFFSCFLIFILCLSVNIVLNACIVAFRELCFLTWKQLKQWIGKKLFKSYRKFINWFIFWIKYFRRFLFFFSFFPFTSCKQCLNGI